MASKLTRSLLEAAHFLALAQEHDGSFMGEARPSQDDSSRADYHPTTFFTALILNCLQGVPLATVVRQRAARFLMLQKSPRWSWNYWKRDSRFAQICPYPDDLDDTMCALAALYRQEPRLIDGGVLAEVAKQLIATEVETGGPYTTWLVGREADAAWRDVDIAVNANIGFFLALQGVQLPGLERFIDDAIRDHKLTSPYYVGEIPVLYFIARWYRGSQIEALKRIIATHLEDQMLHRDTLAQALLITSGLQLGCEPTLVRPAVQRLLQTQVKGSWPAAALYFEPPVKGVQYYAGSRALTTAFCLEALTIYQQTSVKQAPTITSTKFRVRNEAVNQALAAPKELPLDLGRLYRDRIEHLVARDQDGQITRMATIVAAACGLTINRQTLEYLNRGSLEGWVAYTIYDDFWDQEGEPALLGVANVAVRRTIASFQEALPGSQTFHRLVITTLDRVDGATTWEVTHARAALRGEAIILESLPDYGNYAQLAERSWGHSLAAIGALMAAGYAADGLVVQQLQRFFHHFLIARQLCDDAHDWDDDLSHGRLTAVVTLLLGYDNPPTGEIWAKGQRQQLQQRFWQQTIIEVAALVQTHTKAARLALVACSAVRDSRVLLGWLESIERSIRKALDERQEVERFMTTYL